jgi:hypothetical protein
LTWILFAFTVSQYGVHHQVFHRSADIAAVQRHLKISKCPKTCPLVAIGHCNLAFWENGHKKGLREIIVAFIHSNQQSVVLFPMLQSRWLRWRTPMATLLRGLQ